jgi:hypothetical protein
MVWQPNQVASVMKYILRYLLLMVMGYSISAAHAQFTTIINTPPTVIGNGQSIGSNTQLNVSAGGSIGDYFDAPSKDGNHTNVEVNISGGTIGDGFRLLSGSTTNIFGGTIGSGFNANAGSIVNVSGGALGDNFRVYSGSSANISGGDFRIDGTLISGLDVVGNTVPVNIPSDSLFSGTLADGTPFVFIYSEGDGFSYDVLSLTAAALPAGGPAIVMVPSDPAPLGVRNGQTLVLAAGGNIGNHFNAGRSSIVNITGGQIGSNFEAVDAQVTISGGTIGSNFDAFRGSVVNINNGSIGDHFDAWSDSTVNIFGGIVGTSFEARSGSLVNIMGGSVGSSFAANGNCEVNISGGTFGTFFNANGGSVVNISGGTFDNDFNAKSGSRVNLIGTQFVLGGLDITASLSQNSPFTISNRNVTLSGLLADGSPFSFDLMTTNPPNSDFFATGAVLTVTLAQPGDFDNDGDVDGRDFLVWQRNPSLGSLGDWQANYGAGSLSASTAMPEPSAFVLALLGGYLLSRKRLDIRRR